MCHALRDGWMRCFVSHKWKKCILMNQNHNLCGLHRDPFWNLRLMPITLPRLLSCIHCAFYVDMHGTKASLTANPFFPLPLFLLSLLLYMSPSVLYQTLKMKYKKNTTALYAAHWGLFPHPKKHTTLHQQVF